MAVLRRHYSRRPELKFRLPCLSTGLLPFLREWQRGKERVPRTGDWQETRTGVNSCQFSLLLWAGLKSPARVFLGTAAVTNLCRFLLIRGERVLFSGRRVGSCAPLPFAPFDFAHRTVEGAAE